MSGDNGKRSQAATTFRKDEVAVMCQLFQILLRGGDPGVLVRSPEFRRVATKFFGMRDRIG